MRSSLEKRFQEQFVVLLHYRFHEARFLRNDPVYLLLEGVFGDELEHLNASALSDSMDPVRGLPARVLNSTTGHNESPRNHRSNRYRVLKLSGKQ